MPGRRSLWLGHAARRLGLPALAALALLVGVGMLARAALTEPPAPTRAAAVAPGALR